MYPKQTISYEKGFSLIELSIVLVIVGLLMSAGVGIMNSVSKTSKIAKEKANLTIIKNSLITYAFSHGRLPCSDTNGDGSENCPASNCANPPCGLPFIDLSISSVNKDTWSLPYGYDVTDILTTTNSKNLCLALYQLENVYSWLPSPATNVACGSSNLVCVTDTTDGDDGRIGSSGKGYYLAAYTISGGEDHMFGAKNRHDSRREYEMSANPFDTTVNRDDLAGELSFGEIFAKLCNSKNTTIDVIMTSGLVWYSDNEGCKVADGLNGVTVSSGQVIHYNNGSSDGCTGQVGFEDLAKCDVDDTTFAVPNCTTGTTFDGVVNLTIP